MNRPAFIATVCLLGMALGAAPSNREVVLSTRCGSGCNPSPAPFEIPSGNRARHFEIRSLVAGRPCDGKGGDPLKGFSIRKGQTTVLVYYLGPGGPVSDPTPVEDLELGSGSYSLYAAPAAGASVTLAFSIEPAR